ncbi:MAG: hypothetical protein K8S00_11590 [Bacteroidales bacterium]|nr:hypothetical protein [Bacteroidales bacterium]
MDEKTNIGTRCLYITQKSIYEKIRNSDTRLEYIYRYTTENHWDKFISYAIDHNGRREEAEDIFQDSVIVINMNIEEGKIIIRCKVIPLKCTKFLAYFWIILRNKLYSLFRQSGRITNLTDNETIHSIDDGYNSKNSSEDRVSFISYLYKNLDRNDKKRFEIFFIEKLSHEQIVIREDNDITTIDSSKATKYRLRKMFMEEWEKIKNNDQFLDNLRVMY